MAGVKYTGAENDCVISKDRKEIERVIATLENEIKNTQDLVSTLLTVVEPITRTPYPAAECGEAKEQCTETPLVGSSIPLYVILK